MNAHPAAEIFPLLSGEAWERFKADMKEHGSHAAEDKSYWREVYEKSFPGFVAMPNHRANGDHQKAGIDRSIIMPNSKQILIDEKVRLGPKAYDDILLEFVSVHRHPDGRPDEPGWVCKPLLADYIAYAVEAVQTVHLMPVLQLQLAWSKHGPGWLAQYETKTAKTATKGGLFQTLSLPVPIRILYPAIGNCLHIKWTEITIHSQEPL